MLCNRNRIVSAETSQPIPQKESLLTVWPHKRIADLDRKSSPGDGALSNRDDANHGQRKSRASWDDGTMSLCPYAPPPCCRANVPHNLILHEQEGGSRTCVTVRCHSPPHAQTSYLSNLYSRCGIPPSPYPRLRDALVSRLVAVEWPDNFGKIVGAFRRELPDRITKFSNFKNGFSSCLLGPSCLVLATWLDRDGSGDTYPWILARYTSSGYAECPEGPVRHLFAAG